MKLSRVFTDEETVANINSWPMETWEAHVKDSKGKTVFHRKNLEFPANLGWTQAQVNIVSRHYMMKYESSIVTVYQRLVDWYKRHGWSQRYFDSTEDCTIFGEELLFLLFYRILAFNSPAWYNLGVEGHRQQVSACFLHNMEDSMDGIGKILQKEMNIFRWGSGSGVYVGGLPKDPDNPAGGLDGLRSRYERISGKGKSSGPLSFLRGLDTMAGTVKSGGRTRRAAAIRIMGDRHPELLDFIRCKLDEEKVASLLIEAGYSKHFNVRGGAYDRVFFQNANHTVALTDKFMKACEDDADWELYYVCPDKAPEGYERGKPYKVMKAREILRELALAIWECGDPGVSFIDTVNFYNTTPYVGKITTSNPCGEVLVPPPASCNLASIRLTALEEHCQGPVKSLRNLVKIAILAMDISVSASEYPDDEIRDATLNLRPLGLGTCDLGALLLDKGIPYGSDEACRETARLMSEITALSYVTSAEIAKELGSFPAIGKDPCRAKNDFLRVLRHQRDLYRNRFFTEPNPWDEAVETVEKYGIRNSQCTVEPPTGTCSWAIRADTTGIEPFLSPQYLKHLVGGGYEEMIFPRFRKAVSMAGGNLDTLEKTGCLVFDEGVSEETQAVFRTAFGDRKGNLALSPEDHLNALASIVPFISGNASKTLNLPAETTIDEIERMIMTSWRMGLKMVAFYRDASKKSQPLEVSEEKKTTPGVCTCACSRGKKIHLPPELPTIRQKITIKGYDNLEYDLYVHVGLLDEKPMEVFFTLGKFGHMMAGWSDALAIAWSMALQNGVSFDTLVRRFEHIAFEPSGLVSGFGFVKSPIDAVCRWLRFRFLNNDSSTGTLVENISEGQSPRLVGEADNSCPVCGFMIPHSACTCFRCGVSLGCG